MTSYLIRRTLLAVPTLVVIAIVLFGILELTPGDPLADLPLTIPPEVRDDLRAALGLDQAWYIRFGLWLQQLFIVEPLVAIDAVLGTDFADGRTRIVSYQSHAPVMDTIAERLPQTLWVVGGAYVIGLAIAIPLGVFAANHRGSWIDHLITLTTLTGYSMPSFFIGVLVIAVFAVNLGWLPSVYDTTHVVTDVGSLWVQIKQMILPVAILSLFNAGLISRYVRAAMIDVLTQDFVRTAKAKGLPARRVLFGHALRNALLPVITVAALGLPQVFGGAIVTEQVFQVNGLGHLLIIGIQGNDLPLVLTLAFLFAALVVVFNLIADILYAVADPRVRYTDA